MSRFGVWPGNAFRTLMMGFVVAQLIGVPRARAQSEDQRAVPAGTWYAGIATGWYFPIERWNSAYLLGGGGVLLLGYQFQTHLSVRLEVDMSLLAGDRNDTWTLRATPELKWDLGSGRLKPYLWTGAGLAYQATYPGPATTATLVIPVGLGIQWDLDSRTRLFLQAHYDVLLKGLAVQSIPVLGGFEVHF